MPQYKISKAKTARGVRDAVRRWLKDLVTERQKPAVRKLLEQVGEAFLIILEEEYQIKALGGTDSAGIRWPKTKKFAENGYMMIDTRRLIESFEVEITAKGMRVFTRVPYAKYALGRRPAWPDNGFPAKWTNKLLDMITPMIKAYIETRIREEL